MPSFVDLHSHYLPGLDDGAPDLPTAVAMVRAVAGLGFSDLHATPHQRAELWLPERAAIDAALASVDAAVGDGSAGGPGPALAVAAENFWDEVFYRRTRPDRPGELPCYPGGRAFLFEVEPGAMPAGMEQELFRLRVGGRLPVLAHPERYAPVQADIGRAEALGRAAALQVDLGALDGAHGRAAMKTARRLVEEGLAHAAASDIHRPDDARSIAAGIAWIEKRLGAPAVRRLLEDNPRRILAGELP